MKTLKEHYFKYGFDYHLIKRDDQKALYEQKLNGKHISYELFIIISHNGKQFGDQFIPPSELLPSKSNFGSTAWTLPFVTLQRAIECFDLLVQEVDEEKGKIIWKKKWRDQNQS